MYQLGSYIPPFASLPYLIVLTLSSYFNLSPMELGILSLIALPMAYFYAIIERKIRRNMTKAHDYVNSDIDAISGKFILNIIIRQGLIALIIFTFFLSLYFLILNFALPSLRILNIDLFEMKTWTIAFILTAILGGILALRYKKASICFIFVTLALLFIRF